MSNTIDHSQAGPTIQRWKHDKKNPYVMVTNALIRDSSISPNCRWLLIRLLSNGDDWVIHVRQITEECKGFLGRDKVYTLINEAIEAGYMKREEFTEKNLKRIRYVISEEPVFKKCFLFPEFQEAGETRVDAQDESYNSIRKTKERTCLLPDGVERLSDELSQKPTQVQTVEPSENSGKVETGQPTKSSGKIETGQPTQTGNITIQGRKGPEIITESQLYTAIINSKGDWAADEIRYAWKMLAEYKNTVYDWWAFIKGTMQKFRDQKLSDRISNKGLRKTCSQKQTSENSNANTSESVTEEQASPKLSSLMPARWNLTLGNKNHTTH